MSQEQDPPRRRRTSAAPPSPSSSGERRWEVRRTRKPWQRFLERFGFTLIAIGIAMFVGVMIAKMG